MVEQTFKSHGPGLCSADCCKQQSLLNAIVCLSFSVYADVSKITHACRRSKHFVDVFNNRNNVFARQNSGSRTMRFKYDLANNPIRCNLLIINTQLDIPIDRHIAICLVNDSVVCFATINSRRFGESSTTRLNTAALKLPSNCFAARIFCCLYYN